MKILFRVDSSSKIGWGHLMRSLLLAKQYKKDEVIFLCQNLKGNANYKILEEKFKLQLLNSSCIDELIKYINENKIEKLVIDSYTFAYEDEKKIKENCDVKLMVFDDTYEKHYCDILLNHNIYAKKEKYQNLVPTFCDVLCADKYTLVRDEFKKKYQKTKNKTKKIFLCLGGSDIDNISLKVLKAIRSLDFEVELFTTSSNINLIKLKKYVLASSKIKLMLDKKNLALFMSRCDLAIVSPSSIIHELNCLKLPFIGIQTASNQKFMSEYLKEKNVIIFDKSFNPLKLKQELIKYKR